MSTLTKILIVLLTLASIFLCGIVVTYVANSENYRLAVKGLEAERDAAVAKQRKADDLLNEKKGEYQERETLLNKQIAEKTTEVEMIKNELEVVSIQKTNLEEKVQGWVALSDGMTKTNKEQGELLKNSLEELRQVKADQIKQRQQLDDVTKELIEKVAVIETLNKEKRLLEQERAQLQGQLDRYQLRIGKETVPAALVAPQPPPAAPPVSPPVARPVPPISLAPPPKIADIGLKGLITAIDAKNSLAEISIGSAHGVKEGMRFFVTRGDQFVCEIYVFYVDAEKAVGIIEPDRMRYPPKVGDQIATNL
ncbi:MAG TPA: hypothetical protein VMX13_04995 [Sedimentisphaerales bacterium]|nr:hypothetical protein [Sedimentisphaerales bacterium]